MVRPSPTTIFAIELSGRCRQGRPTEAARIGIAFEPVASGVSGQPIRRPPFAGPRIAYEQGVGLRHLHLFWSDHQFARANANWRVVFQI
jgi:hypothetical protein